ncbi:MAG: WYL domain-containing protein [Acidobacteriota bacterium]
MVKGTGDKVPGKAEIENLMVNWYKWDMAKKLSYERYLWFHARIKRGRFPKISDLSEKFEISTRQASREIEFMRNFFNAPIEYSPDESGYYYSDDKFELPGLWASEEDIITLILAKRLSSTIPHKKKKKNLDLFLKKIFDESGIDFEELEKRISLKNIRYYKVSPGIFESVILALNNKKKLKIIYDSPYSEKKTERVISPVHLLLYMGNWHLIAFCEHKKDYRDFVLSRISGAIILKDPIPARLLKTGFKKKIEGKYGIFFEGEQKDVVLRFSPNSSKIVKDQIWFPGQKIEEEKGCVVLTLQVSDFREIIKDILSFGSEVEVISPPELRDLVKEKIKNLKKLYKI